MVFLEHNNNIYMGYDMINSLDYLIQCEDNYTRVDLHYPNNNNVQSATFLNGTSIPVEYNGVLPFLGIRKPTRYKIENCNQIPLPSKFYWDSFGKGRILSKVEAHLNDIESVLEYFEDTDPISSKISCLSLGVMISDTPVFHQLNNTENKKRYDEDMECKVGAVKDKYLPLLNLEKLNSMWGIRLKNTIKNLDTTTNQCHMYTCLIENQLKTKKAQLQYKQLSC